MPNLDRPMQAGAGQTWVVGPCGREGGARLGLLHVFEKTWAGPYGREGSATLWLDHAAREGVGDAGFRWSIQQERGVPGSALP